MTVLAYLVVILIFLYSIIIHEIAHGAMADSLGDPTARLSGRLSLNPLKHLDPIGSVILPLFLILIHSGIVIGWAKPVPINPLNLRDKKYGEAKVAAAGPGVNLLLALLFGIPLRFLPVAVSGFWYNLESVFIYIVWINLLLAIFNLIPVPPLDGAHILFAFLGRGADQIKIFLYRYGLLILLVVLFFFFQWLFPIVNFFFKLITGFPLVL